MRKSLVRQLKLPLNSVRKIVRNCSARAWEGGRTNTHTPRSGLVFGLRAQTGDETLNAMPFPSRRSPDQKVRRAQQHARRYVESKDAAKRYAGGSNVILYEA